MSTYARGRLTSEDACRHVSDIIRGRLHPDHYWPKPKRSAIFDYHCYRLSLAFRDSKGESAAIDATEALFVAVIRNTRALETIDHYRWNLVAFLLRLSRFHERWLDTPDTWKPASEDEEALVLGTRHPDQIAKAQARSLIHHLMVRYPLAEFWDAVWFAGGESNHRQIEWYVHVAQGQNLTTATGLPLKLTKRGAHFMNEAPRGVSLLPAIRWGQLRAMGVPSDLVASLLHTRLATDFENDDVWLPLVRILSQATDLRVETVGHYVDYLYQRAIEDRLRYRYTLKRKTFEMLRREMRAFDGRDPDLIPGQRPAPRPRRWHKAPKVTGWPKQTSVREFECQAPDENDHLICWSIRELNKNYQLVAEGRRMNHCVATYIGKCRSGISSIWSLKSRRNEWLHPEATIEVDPRSRVVVQVRAKHNARPSPQALFVILQWMENNDLKSPT